MGKWYLFNVYTFCKSLCVINEGSPYGLHGVPIYIVYLYDHMWLVGIFVHLLWSYIILLYQTKSFLLLNSSEVGAVILFHFYLLFAAWWFCICLQHGGAFIYTWIMHGPVYVLMCDFLHSVPKVSCVYYALVKQDTLSVDVVSKNLILLFVAVVRSLCIQFFLFFYMPGLSLLHDAVFLETSNN